MPDDPDLSRERIRRLLRALYQEEVRTGAYRAYRRRSRNAGLRSMLDTFLRVEARAVSLLAGHLAALGVGRPGQRGPIRRGLALLGAVLAGITARGGDPAILRRLRTSERRGADRFGREVDWEGWTEGERATFDGHRCDQLYQANWAEELAGRLARDAAGGKATAHRA